MSAETDIQPPLIGVGGWLIWPVANFALIILALIFFIFRHTDNWGAMAAAFVVISHFAATLILTIKHAKAARYMFMFFYMMIFAIDVVVFVITLRVVFAIPALGHDVAIRLVAVVFRGMVEVGTLLYFAFSKRVRQTFTN